jgi:hypothetical protein
MSLSGVVVFFSDSIKGSRSYLLRAQPSRKNYIEACDPSL